MSKSEAFTKAAQKSMEKQNRETLRAEIEANPEMRYAIEKEMLEAHFTPLARALTSLPPNAEGRRFKAEYVPEAIHYSLGPTNEIRLAVGYLKQDENIDLDAYKKEGSWAYVKKRPVFLIRAHYTSHHSLSDGEPLIGVENHDQTYKSTMAGAPHITTGEHYKHRVSMNPDEAMAYIAEVLTGIAPERMEEIVQAVSTAYAKPLAGNASPQQKSTLLRPG